MKRIVTGFIATGVAFWAFAPWASAQSRDQDSTGGGQGKDNASADSPATGLNPDAPPETEQFAFMVGDWDCTIRRMGPDGQYAEARARWTGFFILDGYAIQDDWKVPQPDGTWRTTGFNVRHFDAKKGRWMCRWLSQPALTWVQYEAWQEGETMIMLGGAGQDPRGPYIDRNTFSNIAAEVFSWKKDRSYDGGKTWIEGVALIEAKRIYLGSS